MSKLLVVIDMQEDFTYGALHNDEAIAVIPKVVEKVKNYDGMVVFTRDTHTPEYMDTQEGRKLPVVHCVKDTRGWEIVEPLQKLVDENHYKVFDKPAFGSVELMQAVVLKDCYSKLEEIELVGVCTDICVISNAMLLKNALPEVTIKVDSSCCAGVSVESHKTALEAMKACHIEVL